MYFQFSYHPETVLPLSILQCWDQLLTDIRYEINMHIRSDGQKKEHIGDVALSTDDLISITIFILLKSLWSCGVVRRRNLSSSLPAHFALIDSFTPCELSCSVLGYAYGIMETAMTWIMKNGKQWLVCSLYVARRSEIPYAYADFSIWPSLISNFSVNFSFIDLFLYG